MCSGRVDLEFVFRALAKGLDGVFIGGCRLNECNYVTQGNYDALALVLLSRKILEHMGIHPERLEIAFMSAGEGILFAETVNRFVGKIKEIGPLGESEGLSPTALALKCQAVLQLIPYIKLVEREQLRPPVKSETAYRAFFADPGVNEVIRETILDRLTVGQMTLLLKKTSLPMSEIAERLGLSPSEVSRYLNQAARQGWVRYDQARKGYTLASAQSTERPLSL